MEEYKLKAGEGMEKQPLSEETGRQILRQLRVIKRVVVGFSMTFLVGFVALIAMLIVAGTMLQGAMNKLNNFNIFGGSSTGSSSSSSASSDTSLKDKVCSGSGTVTEYAKQQGWCN